MSKLIDDLRARTGLNMTQLAVLLAVPKPTLYQYRRSGEMPSSVERMLRIIARLNERQLQTLVDEYVFGVEL